MSNLRSDIRQALTEIVSSLGENQTIEKKVAKKQILEKLGASDDKAWGVSAGGISVFQSNLSNIVDDMRKKGLLSTPSSDTYGHHGMGSTVASRTRVGSEKKEEVKKAYNAYGEIPVAVERKAYNAYGEIPVVEEPKKVEEPKVVEEPKKVVDKPISFDNDEKIVLIEEPKKPVVKSKVDSDDLFEGLDEPKSEAERLFRGHIRERGIGLLNMAINYFVGKKGQGGCYGDYTVGDEACDGNPSCPLRGFCKKEKDMR